MFFINRLRVGLPLSPTCLAAIQTSDTVLGHRTVSSGNLPRIVPSQSSAHGRPQPQCKAFFTSWERSKKLLDWTSKKWLLWHPEAAFIARSLSWGRHGTRAPLIPAEEGRTTCLGLKEPTTGQGWLPLALRSVPSWPAKEVMVGYAPSCLSLPSPQATISGRADEYFMALALLLLTGLQAHWDSTPFYLLHPPQTHGWEAYMNLNRNPTAP